MTPHHEMIFNNLVLRDLKTTYLLLYLSSTVNEGIRTAFFFFLRKDFTRTKSTKNTKRIKSTRKHKKAQKSTKRKQVTSSS